MPNKELLEQFVWLLTLELRQKTRHLWMKRGPFFLKNHPNFLIDYWTKRLTKNIPNELAVYKRFENMALRGVVFPQYVQPSTSLNLVKNVSIATVNWIKSGLKITPKDMIEERKKICTSCEFWNALAMKGTGKCLKCGCSTWAKIRMASESCPLNKWKPVAE